MDLDAKYTNSLCVESKPTLDTHTKSMHMSF